MGKRARSLARTASIGLFFLVSTVGVARANRGECTFDTSGARTCAPPTSCTTRATCIESAAAADQTCQTVLAGTTTARECMPDCTTSFSCTTALDCPRVNGLIGLCSPISGISGSSSLCTWSTPDSSVPLAAQITYCVGPTSHVSATQIALCHRRADMPSEYTPDYYRGDCDGDGCPNGADTDPCAAPAAGETCDAGIATPFESPFCAPLPALACEVTGSGLSCGDARPCSVGSPLLPCAVGACEDGWSDVPRCRPPCSTLFLCATGTLPGGGAPPEQCPVFDGMTGACLPLPSTLPGSDGRDGVCIYPEFFDSSCVPSTLSQACLVDVSGSFTANFFEGDCDMDGAPNGCDLARCTSGGGTADCMPVPGIGCTPTYTPPVDAGAEADAGTDAGDSQTDAGTTSDAGAASDAGVSESDAASSPMDGGLAVGFGGGGGCRCAAVGVRARPIGGVALACLALLGLRVRRRARRC